MEVTVYLNTGINFKVTDPTYVAENLEEGFMDREQKLVLIGGQWIDKYNILALLTNGVTVYRNDQI